MDAYVSNNRKVKMLEAVIIGHYDGFIATRGVTFINIMEWHRPDANCGG